MIKRLIKERFDALIQPNKVLVIYGPRRVGKTTLVEDYLSDYKGRLYKSTGENIQLKNILESSDFSKIIPFFSSYDLIFIDEAQNIDNIGHGLKIIVDQIPGIKVIVTGSSSFDLTNKVGEPLVGRQFVCRLYPIAVSELYGTFGSAYMFENLNNILVFGSYPDVINTVSFDEKISFLSQIRDSYLLKDMLQLEGIKNSKKIFDLLRLIAFQVGREVSLSELGRQLELSRNTVERYLDLLEKAFILVNLRGYSRNLRKEITKTSKYYFFDNGVRNAIIGNFNILEHRDDIGALWENFLVSERLKKQAYKPIYSGNYFWRTWDKQEIDWVEERDGNVFGFEFKYSESKVLVPGQWREAYPKAEFNVVNKNNYVEFVM